MTHSLHLIVTAAIEECHGVVSVINTTRQITITVHMSNKAIAKLHEIQGKLGLGSGCSACWSRRIAVVRVMDLGVSVSEHQWTLMEAIVTVLEPFEEGKHPVCQDETSISSVICCIQASRAALTGRTDNKDVSNLLDTRKQVVLLQSHLEESFQHVNATLRPQI